MEEVKVKQPRSAAEIQADYAHLCQVAGDKQYKKQVLEAELIDINQKLMTLNIEYDIAKKEATKELEIKEELDENPHPTKTP